jgi:flagellar biosynthesis protein FliQ
MEIFDPSTLHQALRVATSAVIPLMLVPLIGFGVAVVQGMMGTREDSVNYSARMLAAVGIVVLFGAAVWEGFQELVVYCLR